VTGTDEVARNNIRNTIVCAISVTARALGGRVIGLCMQQVFWEASSTTCAAREGRAPVEGA